MSGRRRGAAEAATTFIYLAAVVWWMTPPARRRLWAMRALGAARAAAADAAWREGRAAMRRELAGRRAAYELPAALSRARDGVAGLYERMRAG